MLLGTASRHVFTSHKLDQKLVFIPEYAIISGFLCSFVHSTDKPAARRWFLSCLYDVLNGPKKERKKEGEKIGMKQKNDKKGDKN